MSGPFQAIYGTVFPLLVIGFFLAFGGSAFLAWMSAIWYYNLYRQRVDPNHPSAVTRAGFSKGRRIIFQRQPDPELERARKRTLRLYIATIVAWAAPIPVLCLVSLGFAVAQMLAAR
jgi:hypothetical protein